MPNLILKAFKPLAAFALLTVLCASCFAQKTIRYEFDYDSADYWKFFGSGGSGNEAVVALHEALLSGEVAAYEELSGGKTRPITLELYLSRTFKPRGPLSNDFWEAPERMDSTEFAFSVDLLEPSAPGEPHALLRLRLIRDAYFAPMVIASVRGEEAIRFFRDKPFSYVHIPQNQEEGFLCPPDSLYHVLELLQRPEALPVLRTYTLLHPYEGPPVEPFRPDPATRLYQDERRMFLLAERDAPGFAEGENFLETLLAAVTEGRLAPYGGAFDTARYFRNLSLLTFNPDVNTFGTAYPPLFPGMGESFYVPAYGYAETEAALFGLVAADSAKRDPFRNFVGEPLEDPPSHYLRMGAYPAYYDRVERNAGSAFGAVILTTRHAYRADGGSLDSERVALRVYVLPDAHPTGIYTPVVELPYEEALEVLKQAGRRDAVRWLKRLPFAEGEPFRISEARPVGE